MVAIRSSSPFISALDVGVGMTSMRTRTRLVELLKQQGISDSSVLTLVLNIPRHKFIDEALASRAYDNNSLPIGHGQTISQPFTVALMTQTLFNLPRKRVLEIGTGCGYQCAFLSACAETVVTIERIRDLYVGSRDRLRDFRVNNVISRHGDGFNGLRHHAPYDGIVAAAVSNEVPQALIDQLAEGGRIVMPIGGGDQQELIVIDKINGETTQKKLSSANFVPRLAGVQ